jgi:peptidoglycan/xylan/chitin deacetylase (PgdA/CDA1 family)
MDIPVQVRAATTVCLPVQLMNRRSWHLVSVVNLRLVTQVLGLQPASPAPLAPATIRQIERCYNTTNDVWLTFDDGGSAAQVTSILATLKRNNVKGRFFFRGDWARKNHHLRRLPLRPPSPPAASSSCTATARTPPPGSSPSSTPSAPRN